MSFDAHTNFGYSTVATAPSPATSGTSLTLATGEGARFPDPSTDGAFNLTVWPTGVAPLSTNAEIVRCTARIGDVLTIDRTQEGTSARTIIVGDQVALAITKKVVTDIEATIDPSVVLAAAPTGVAATDNAAIAAAITACPTGGVVQLQSGTYAITGLTIAKTLTLRGRGGADALWANFGTLLTLDSATAVGIQISSHGVKLENFAVQNTHATAPTAGAGIRTVTGGGNSTHYGPNLSVRGFYYCVDHQAGGEWVMDPSCFMYDFVFCGLRIQNVDSTDGGDMTVSGNFIAGPTNNATAGIQWLSGGGFKGYGIKINTRNSKTLTAGIGLEITDGISTSDFLLTDSSIENVSYGVLVETNGASHTGTFNNIIVCGNQFLIGGSSTPQIGVAVVLSATSQVAKVNVLGNVFRESGVGTTRGIKFQNIDNAAHGPNIFGGFTSNFFDGGGNTNIVNMETSLSSPLTTKGDLWGFGSADARLAVGADGKILVADAAQTLGVGYSTLDLDAASHKIKNVTDPTSAQDAATKNYVDTHGGSSGVSSLDSITGAVSLVAGTNVTITDNSPSAGSITIASSGGGSGLSKSQLGYTTIGGSSVTATSRQVIAKQITPGSAGTIIGLAIYLKWQADMVAYINAAVFDDNSSTIGKLLGYASAGSHPGAAATTAGAGGIDAHQTSEVARWVTIPLVCELAASTPYWIGFSLSADATIGGTLPLIFFDGSGTDRRYTTTPFSVGDGQSVTQGTDSRKHSLYAVYLS